VDEENSLPACSMDFVVVDVVVDVVGTLKNEVAVETA
jgi:hypothetical protein